MLLLKAGVSLRKLQPQMLIALQVVEEEFGKYSLDTVITSGSDGQHKEGSLHYAGLALDFRTKAAAGIQKGLASMIKLRLDHVGFDVVLEDLGQDNEHLHVEFDPKEGE